MIGKCYINHVVIQVSNVVAVGQLLSASDVVTAASVIDPALQAARNKISVVLQASCNLCGITAGLQDYKVPTSSHIA